MKCKVEKKIGLPGIPTSYELEEICKKFGNAELCNKTRCSECAFNNIVNYIAFKEATDAD